MNFWNPPKKMNCKNSKTIIKATKKDTLICCAKIESRGPKLHSTNSGGLPSNTKFSLVYFKTGLSVMSDSLALYQKNIFSVCREFAYEDKEDSFRVDLALFINGIPMVMIELKQTAGRKLHLKNKTIQTI